MDEEMDDGDQGWTLRYRYVFKTFVCVSLTVLLGLHIHSYFSASGETLEGDFSDIKYVVTQLTRGLTEVNRKHEDLKTEIERISSTIPSMEAATTRAKAALTASCRRGSTHSLEMGDYDRQITDFALESAGARVLDTGDTAEHVVLDSPVSYALYLLTSMMCRSSQCLSARAMLRPGALPGECWAFKGPRGEATIRLLGTIHITGVSLEHIPAHIAPTKEISSAPRLFQLDGLEYRADQYPHDFGTFEYDIRGKPIQYFEVRHPTSKGYNLVRLRVISNWGHPVFTCVYRLRIHGELAPGQSPRLSEDDMRIDNE